MITNSSELIVAIESARCCLGNKLYEAVVSEKKGDVLQSDNYREQYNLLLLFIQSMELYDFSHDINCITLDDVNNINQKIEEVCGCNYIASDNIGSNINSCDLAKLSFAISNDLSYVWAIDSRGNTDVLLSKTSYEFYESPDDTPYTWELCQKKNLINRGYITSLSNFFKMVATCNGTSELIIGKIDPTAFYFNNYISYKINGGIYQYTDTEEILALETDEIELFANDSETECVFTILPANVLADNKNYLLVKSDLEDADYEVNLAITVIDKLPNSSYVDANMLIRFVPVPIISGNDFRCEGATVTLTATYDSNLVKVYDTYQWYKDGVLLVGETANTHDATVDGSYNIVVTVEHLTLTSEKRTVTTSKNKPHPKITIDWTTIYGNKYLFDEEDNRMICSVSFAFDIIIVDEYIFKDGYPPTTEFELIGYYGYQASNIFTITSVDTYTANAKMGVSYGECDTDTDPLDVIVFQEEQTVYTCANGTDDLPIITATKISNTEWSLNATDFGLCGHDYTAGAAWVKLYDLGTHTSTAINGVTGRPFANIGTGNSIIVTEKGMYGFYSTDITFGQILIAVK